MHVCHTALQALVILPRQVYMAGHGGNGFMKFQDQEELTSSQLADALAAMQAQACPPPYFATFAGLSRHQHVADASDTSTQLVMAAISAPAMGCGALLASAVDFYQNEKVLIISVGPKISWSALVFKD